VEAIGQGGYKNFCVESALKERNVYNRRCQPAVVDIALLRSEMQIVALHLRLLIESLLATDANALHQ